MKTLYNFLFRRSTPSHLQIKVSPLGGDLEGALGFSRFFNSNLKVSPLRGRFRGGLFLLPLAFCLSLSHAQTRVTAPLNSAGTYGQYYNYNNGSVVMAPGFLADATSGPAFHAYITSSECMPMALNLTKSQNYVLTTVPRVSGITDTGMLHGSTCQLMQTVQYIDGLGRPLQTVQVAGSANGLDVVQPFAYDAYGREAMKYLSYASNTYNGSYKAAAINSSLDSFYNAPPAGVANIPNPFAQTIFEASPLNRPFQQGAPGNAWQPLSSGIPGSGHVVKNGYGINASNEVPLWLSSGSGAAWGSTYYPAGTLYKDTTTDENGHLTITFTDKQQHIVCKKVQGDGGFISTNYIYDDLERLAYVVPPIPTGTTYPTSFTEADAIFNNFIYGYHYDERSRIVEKKIPGKGWEYMIYNLLDQLVMTQDAVQRSKSPQQWTFTKYDAQARVVMTGIYTDDEHSDPGTNYRQNFQGIVNYFPAYETRDYTSTTTGYTNNAIPMGSITGYLSINYYDNYTSIPGLPAGYSAPTGASSMTTGLPTASLTNVLGTGDMLWNVNYYDDLGRVNTTYKQHYLGGTANTSNYDAVTNTYNFTNQVTATTRQHYTAASGLALTIANTYTYDHVGRKTQTYEQINGGANTLISQTDYNEIGQPLKKHLGNDAQQIAYAYNERGWLTQSNAPLLNLQLKYNDGSLPQYNGNIAEMSYTAPNSSKTFDYTYDPLNRLTLSNAGTGNALNEAIAYDNRGNITSMARNGQSYGTLGYAYTGNQLTGVTGTGFTSRSYSYDANGNATSDGMTKAINYNMLNLPSSLTQSGNTIATYVYDAEGTKLRTTSNADSTWDYISGIAYRNGAIAYVATEEGRAINEAGNYVYQYNLKDHLGNNRIAFDKNPSTGAVRELQEDEYYAFGLRNNLFGSGNSNRYLYNGKEIQTDLTNQYDYGARLYDPVIGRWNTPDPLAEVSRRWSPYNYGENNPVRNIDPDGMAVMLGQGENGGDLYTGADAIDLFKSVQQQKPKPKSNKQSKSQTDWSWWTDHIKKSINDFLYGIPAFEKKGYNPFQEYANILGFELAGEEGVNPEEFSGYFNPAKEVISEELRSQKQLNEHTLGGKEVGGNSYLKTIGDAQKVLDDLHTGNTNISAILSINAGEHRLYVQDMNVTGYYNNNGQIIETHMFLIKGGKSATVVPVHPQTTKFK